MTDVEYFLIGAAFGLSIKIFVAFVDAMSAMFEKDKQDLKNDKSKNIE